MSANAKKRKRADDSERAVPPPSPLAASSRSIPIRTFPLLTRLQYMNPMDILSGRVVMQTSLSNRTLCSLPSSRLLQPLSPLIVEYIGQGCFIEHWGGANAIRYAESLLVVARLSCRLYDYPVVYPIFIAILQTRVADFERMHLYSCLLSLFHLQSDFWIPERGDWQLFKECMEYIECRCPDRFSSDGIFLIMNFFMYVIASAIPTSAHCSLLYLLLFSQQSHQGSIMQLQRKRLRSQVKISTVAVGWLAYTFRLREIAQSLPQGKAQTADTILFLLYSMMDSVIREALHIEDAESPSSSDAKSSQSSSSSSSAIPSLESGPVESPAIV